MADRPGRLHLWASPLTGVEKSGRTAAKAGRDESLGEDQPHFHKHHEARPIELFYDLFFVGNLSVFTYIHPVNDAESLASYIGFFSLLWLTWLQVTLFDVRFGNDSIVERLLKAFQLGGMIGFSIVGSNFLPSKLLKDRPLLIGFSCILMGTRLALTAQYSISMWASRKYHQGMNPLILHTAASFMAAVAYAIMAAAFVRQRTSRAYAAWYVIAIMETAATFAVARLYKIASFRGTHLAERMSLLTLIIIGEGIIVLMKSIQAIVINGAGTSPATIGNIFSVAVIYFFLYMLYFDKLRKTYFGLVREEIWALLHYPFHVALILFVEGINEIMIARRFYEVLLVQIYKYAYFADTPTMELGGALTRWIEALAAEFPDAIAKSKDIISVNKALVNLNNTKALATPENLNNNTDANTVVAYGVQLMFSAFGLKQSADDENLSLIDRIGADMEIFQLIFGYLFVTGGLILIFLAAFSYINKTYRTRLAVTEWITIGAHIVTGLALTLVSTLLVERPNFNNRNAKTIYELDQNVSFIRKTGRSGRFLTYSTGPWVLPTIVFCYLFVVLVSVGVMMFPRNGRAENGGLQRQEKHHAEEANGLNAHHE